MQQYTYFVCTAQKQSGAEAETEARECGMRHSLPGDKAWGGMWRLGDPGGG